MLREVEWLLETGFAGCAHSGKLEFEDGATDEEIEEAVDTEVYNRISWSWWDPGGSREGAG